MSDITLDKFKNWYSPFFDKLNDDRFNMALDFASRQIYKPVWDSLYLEGMYSLIAHILVINGFGAKSNNPNLPQQISNTSVGNVSVGFTGNSANTNVLGTYASTKFGLRYLELLELTKRYAITL